MNAAQKAFFEEKERSLGVYLNDVQKQAVLQTNGRCYYWHLLVQEKQRRLLCVLAI